MKRGDVVIAGERGSFAGKPRPWLVLQADDFLDDPFSVTVAMISSTAEAALFRIPVLPSSANGLDEASLILADKIVTLRAMSVIRVAGSIDRLSMTQVENAVRMWLDL